MVPATLLLFFALLALAQTPSRPAINGSPPPRVITPEQKQYQADVALWLTHRNELRTQAQNARNAEMAREKAGDCPNANTTRAQEECLAAEGRKTQANYAAFATAIRAMLALSYPTQAGEPAALPETPPTGERAAEFDRLEAESKAYRDDAVKAARDQFTGGTLAPVFALEAAQKLLRLHLQEMGFIYGEELTDR
jgi:hypothetical protein